MTSYIVLWIIEKIIARTLRSNATVSLAQLSSSLVLYLRQGSNRIMLHDESSRDPLSM